MISNLRFLAKRNLSFITKNSKLYYFIFYLFIFFFFFSRCTLRIINHLLNLIEEFQLFLLILHIYYNVYIYIYLTFLSLYIYIFNIYYKRSFMDVHLLHVELKCTFYKISNIYFRKSDKFTSNKKNRSVSKNSSFLF